MRGADADWMNQREGFASALSRRQHVAALTSWWVDVPRERWDSAVRDRWRGSDARQSKIDDE